MTNAGSQVLKSLTRANLGTLELDEVAIEVKALREFARRTGFRRAILAGPIGGRELLVAIGIEDRDEQDYQVLQERRVVLLLGQVAGASCKGAASLPSTSPASDVVAKTRPPSFPAFFASSRWRPADRPPSEAATSGPRGSCRSTRGAQTAHDRRLPCRTRPHRRSSNVDLYSVFSAVVRRLSPRSNEGDEAQERTGSKASGKSP